MIDRNNIFYNFFANLTQSGQDVIPSEDLDKILPVLEASLKSHGFDFIIYESSKYGPLNIIDLAVIIGDIEVVKYFTGTKKLDVNAKTPTGVSLLHLAGLYDKTANSEMIKYLIAKGADLDALDNNNKTPLKWLDEVLTSEASEDSLLTYYKNFYTLLENKADSSMVNLQDMQLRLAGILRVKDPLFSLKIFELIEAHNKIVNTDKKGYDVHVTEDNNIVIDYHSPSGVLHLEINPNSISGISDPSHI